MGSVNNNEPVGVSIQIRGFYSTGTTKTEYVLDVLSLAPGGVSNNNYYAQFEAFEFRFIISADNVEISAWGNDAAGNVTVVHRVLPALDPLGLEGVAGATELTMSSM